MKECAWVPVLVVGRMNMHNIIHVAGWEMTGKAERTIDGGHRKPEETHLDALL